MHLIVLEKRLVTAKSLSGEIFQRAEYRVRYPSDGTCWVTDAYIHNEHITYGFASFYKDDSIEKTNRHRIINAF